MKRIRKILATTDFSERAQWAERRAELLGTELACETLEVMVAKKSAVPDRYATMGSAGQMTHDELLLALAERDRETTCGPLSEGLPPTRVRSVRFGNPVTEILARADELPADLTVISPSGGSFFSTLFNGYNPEKLINRSNRPMLVVKNKPEGPYRSVLVAVDFSAASREAASIALDIAPDAMMLLVHAFHMPDEGQMRETGVYEDIIRQYRFNAAEKARRELDRFIADLGSTRKILSRVVRGGVPERVIHEAAETMQPDLIAMGQSSKSWFGSTMLGSVASRLVNYSRCDLLIAPAAKGLKRLEDQRVQPAA